MAENTKIEWAHHTFNPWEGCTKVGPGCDHCYAETRNKRFHGDNWGPGAPRRRTSEANWKKPLKWNREAEALGIRYRVFCASLADVFDNDVPQQWRGGLWSLIESTPHLDWLLLTKRIGNVNTMIAEKWGRELPPNVWIGATVVNQEEANRDIPKLLNVKARVRFLSMEPLLGPVDLTRLNGCPLDNRYMESDCCDALRCVSPGHVDWVIVGGESGTGARPMQAEWVRSLRDQCMDAGVPFLFKQWGEWAPNWYNDDQRNKIPGSEWMDRMGKKAAGRMLDDKEWNEFPDSGVAV